MGYEKETFLNALVILTGLLTAMLQFYSGGDVGSLTVLGILAVVISINFISSWIKDKLVQLDILRARMDKLEERLDYMKKIQEIENNMTRLETRLGSRGAIDPQVVIVVIILILFILYLRVSGFI